MKKMFKALVALLAVLVVGREVVNPGAGEEVFLPEIASTGVELPHGHEAAPHQQQTVRLPIAGASSSIVPIFVFDPIKVEG